MNPVHAFTSENPWLLVNCLFCKENWRCSKRNIAIFILCCVLAQELQFRFVVSVPYNPRFFKRVLWNQTMVQELKSAVIASSMCQKHLGFCQKISAYGVPLVGGAPWLSG